MHNPAQGTSRAVAVLTALCLTAAVPASAGTLLGAETPQALVERMAKAAQAKDVGEVVACLEPESRAEMTMGLVLGTTMMLAFMEVGPETSAGIAEGMAETLSGEEMTAEEKAKLEAGKAEAAAKTAKAKADLSAIFKKHGMPDLVAEDAAPPEDTDPKAMLEKVDQPALAAELFAFMDTLGGTQSEGEATSSIPDPKKVTGYQISGDRGTAKAGDETLEFVKLDGRWFLKTPKEQES